VRKFDIDGKKITVKTDLKSLGRLPEGYPTGGDYGDDIIRIAKGHTQSGYRCALLHELLHHLWEREGLHKIFSTKDEEHIVDALSRWLVAASATAPDLYREMFNLE
jgi:hypothetical protein